MAVRIFGHTVSTPAAATIAGGSALAIWFAWKQHKASSSSGASNPSAIDPVTGLPYSQDNQIDPLTGQAYLAEAQEYGSVSAAENAVAGESSLDYSTTGSGLAGTSTGTSLEPATTVAGTTYASNAAWAQAVEAGLTDIGYTSTDVAAALGRYLANLSETPAQATIVQAAIAEYGPPPVGSYQVIMASTTPASPTGTTTTTTTTGTTTGSATWSYPAPTGLKVVQTAAKGVKISWNPVTGPQGQHPSTYTVATYSSAGAEVDQFTSGATTTEEFGKGGGGLPKGTYHINVWANGGPNAPAHATVSFTLTA